MCYHPSVDYIDQLIYLSSIVPVPTCSHGSADLPELVSPTCTHGLADLPELQGAITHVYSRVYGSADPCVDIKINWFTWDPRCYHPCVDYKDQLIFLSSNVPSTTCSDGSDDLPELQGAIIHACWFTWAPRCHRPRIPMDQLIYLGFYHPRVAMHLLMYMSSKVPSPMCTVEYMDQLIYLSSKVPSPMCT